MIYKTVALILSKEDFGEADRMYKVLSPTHGVIQLKAKGARWIKSRLTPNLEELSEVELTVAKGGKFDTITGSVTLSRYPLTRKTLQGLSSAAVITSYLAEFVKDGQKEIYDEARRALFAIESESLKGPLVASSFAWRLLSLSGFAPSLSNCSICSERLIEGTHCFSSSAGGLLCRREQQSGPHLSATEIKILRFICRSSIDEVLKLKQDIPIKKFNLLAADFVRDQIGRSPKALMFSSLVKL